MGCTRRGWTSDDDIDTCSTGVFYVDGEMPEGQAVMAELIGAAHKLVHKISNNMA